MEKEVAYRLHGIPCAGLQPVDRVDGGRDIVLVADDTFAEMLSLLCGGHGGCTKGAAQFCMSGAPALITRRTVRRFLNRTAGRPSHVSVGENPHSLRFECGMAQEPPTQGSCLRNSVRLPSFSPLKALQVRDIGV